jgi:hypothetical protein
VVLVGVPTPQMTLEMPLIEFFGHGGALKSSWYGDCLPSRDFPLLIELSLQGRLPLDAFVSERIGLGDVEEAFHRMERGEVLRSVVVMDGRRSDRPHRAPGHQRHLQPGRRDLRRRQQRLAARRRRRGDGLRRAARPGRHRGRRRRPDRGRHRLHARPRRPRPVAPELAERLSTSILLHPDDRVLWDLTHARHEPDGNLRDGQTLEVAGTKVKVLHTPGHAPGAVCFSVPDLGVVLSGDTLFSGGPGATGRSYSDYPTILDSIRTRLFTLPPETRVLTGHGDETTVGRRGPLVRRVGQADHLIATS